MDVLGINSKLYIMRNLRNFLAVAIMLLTYTTSVAMVQDGVDVENPLSIVAYLTPFIVFGAVQLVKIIKPLVPAWLLGVIVPGISAGVAFLQTATENADSWLTQFGLGLAATFVHQIYKQLIGAGK